MDLYAEIILDHYKHPHHFGLLKKANLRGKDLNPLCGDKLEITLKVDRNNVVQDVGFKGEGCAISIAAMSILSDEIVGMTLDQIKKIDSKIINQLLQIEVSPGRSKCALLGLSLIKKLIKIYEKS
jgi:nitrogen fixation protein NifU and related proteins